MAETEMEREVTYKGDQETEMVMEMEVTYKDDQETEMVEMVEMVEMADSLDANGMICSRQVYPVH